mmetsp:Transcript_8185/g.15960  ORF Transcript_8185/g.15960 Transcript_8185/m.15960 type:complete len:85 (+) Transcript_8185:424-678(+)
MPDCRKKKDQTATCISCCFLSCPSSLHPSSVGVMKRVTKTGVSFYEGLLALAALMFCTRWGSRADDLPLVRVPIFAWAFAPALT